MRAFKIEQSHAQLKVMSQGISQNALCNPLNICTPPKIDKSIPIIPKHNNFETNIRIYGNKTQFFKFYYNLSVRVGIEHTRALNVK